ncbi:hypothetical protein [Enterococcus lactis]|uniref:hypothetical protein n=1 Tax=Enterococcus lactis TaxID=357441 RepID=UPI0022E52A4C|nr:hypothetical protein [Enterococcus lactis]
MTDNVVKMFEKQVVKSPNAIAVEFKDESFTYKELNEKANTVAHFLVTEKKNQSWRHYSFIVGKK